METSMCLFKPPFQHSRCVFTYAVTHIFHMFSMQSSAFFPFFYILTLENSYFHQDIVHSGVVTCILMHSGQNLKKSAGCTFVESTELSTLVWPLEYMSNTVYAVWMQFKTHWKAPGVNQPLKRKCKKRKLVQSHSLAWRVALAEQPSQPKPSGRKIMAP